MDDPISTLELLRKFFWIAQYALNSFSLIFAHFRLSTVVHVKILFSSFPFSLLSEGQLFIALKDIVARIFGFVCFYLFVMMSLLLIFPITFNHIFISLQHRTMVASTPLPIAFFFEMCPRISKGELSVRSSVRQQARWSPDPSVGPCVLLFRCVLASL